KKRAARPLRLNFRHRGNVRCTTVSPESGSSFASLYVATVPNCLRERGCSWTSAEWLKCRQSLERNEGDRHLIWGFGAECVLFTRLAERVELLRPVNCTNPADLMTGIKSIGLPFRRLLGIARRMVQE